VSDKKLCYHSHNFYPEIFVNLHVFNAPENEDTVFAMLSLYLCIHGMCRKFSKFVSKSAVHQSR
jgi:hypothetical protein